MEWCAAVNPLLICKHQFGATIFHAIVKFRSFPKRIYSNRNSANGCDGAKCHRPFGVIAHGNGNTVSLFDAILADHDIGDFCRTIMCFFERVALVFVNDETFVRYAAGI